ncbi:MAG: hypothetical protein ACXVCY_15615 [Pseudobdellovibrionaceae bacterium]
MKKLVMAALMVGSVNVVLVSHAHALGVTQTAVAATLLPSETVTALLSGVEKEVVIEAKKHALVAVQSNYAQVSPFLQAFIDERKAEQPALTSNVSDQALINAIAGIEAK